LVPKDGSRNNFIYDTTSNWQNLNPGFLSKYQVVLFLDSRPETEDQRNAFKNYMDSGGAWMGFHFAAFSLTPSAYPQNWDWYHQQFLGTGAYVSNTWRPVPAVLTRGGNFASSHQEFTWYISFFSKRMVSLGK
jgi:hypothetical protein